MSLSQHTPTEPRRDLVSSVHAAGNIHNTPSRGSSCPRRSPYERVAAHDLDNKGREIGGDIGIAEKIQNPEMNQRQHDAKDYQNFCTDGDNYEYDHDYDCDYSDTVIDISGDEEDQQESYSAPQYQLSPLPHTRCSPFSKHDSHNYNQIHSQSPVPPQNYICPLTLQLMEFPVHDGCGHTFERRAIVQWLGATNTHNRNEPICPISRKPMLPLDDGDGDDTNTNTNTESPTCDRVFRSDPDLQRRILEWKLNHPLYQGVDAEYARHQRETMLYHHDDSCDRDEDDNSTTGSSSHGSHHYRLSRFELILLPQERRVLKLLQTRARLRKEQLARKRWMHRCLLVSMVVAIVALVSFYAVVQYRGLGVE